MQADRGISGRPAGTGICQSFIEDIADRVKHRIQLTSDGLKMYVTAVLNTFEWDGIDFAQLLKIYGSHAAPAGQARYSPGECIGCVIRPMLGDPGPEAYQHVLQRENESHNPHDVPKIHPAHEWVLQEVAQPRTRYCPALLRLQFLPQASAWDNPGG